MTTILLIAATLALLLAFRSRSPAPKLLAVLLGLALAGWSIHDLLKPVTPSREVLSTYEDEGRQLAQAALAEGGSGGGLLIVPPGSSVAELRAAGIRAVLGDSAAQWTTVEFNSSASGTIPVAEYLKLVEATDRDEVVISLAGLPAAPVTNGQRLIAYSTSGKPEAEAWKNCDVRAVAWYEAGPERPVFNVTTLPR